MPRLPVRLGFLLLALTPMHVFAACSELFEITKPPCRSGETAIFGRCHRPTQDQSRCVNPVEFRWKGNVCMVPVWADCKENVS